MRDNSNKPTCPDCGHHMHKAGGAWSGHRKVQRYACSQCGRIYVSREDYVKSR